MVVRMCECVLACTCACLHDIRIWIADKTRVVMNTRVIGCRSNTARFDCFLRRGHFTVLMTRYGLIGCVIGTVIGIQFCTEIACLCLPLTVIVLSLHFYLIGAVHNYTGVFTTFPLLAREVEKSWTIEPEGYELGRLIKSGNIMTLVVCVGDGAMTSPCSCEPDFTWSLLLESRKWKRANQFCTQVFKSFGRDLGGRVLGLFIETFGT